VFGGVLDSLIDSEIEFGGVLKETRPDRFIRVENASWFFVPSH
jgi:hypothetical protein